jgi:hypothetical protein
MGTMTRTPTRAELDELALKYDEMLRLRLADDRGEMADPRAAMAALAGRFPGALREIDELPLGVIRARRQALRAAGEDPSRIEPWMKAQALFHALTRGALCAKRWLAGHKTVDDDARQAFAREAASLCYADDARAWAGDLARVARPPRGRVTDLVFERIAGELGVSNAEARHLVFGPSRRERKRQAT